MISIIYYGSIKKHKNITGLLYKNYCKKNVIFIPKNDYSRIKLFGDPHPNAEKFIIIHNNNKKYAINSLYDIYFDINTRKFYTHNMNIPLYIKELYKEHFNIKIPTAENKFDISSFQIDSINNKTLKTNVFNNNSEECCIPQIKEDGLIVFESINNKQPLFKLVIIPTYNEEIKNTIITEIRLICSHELSSSLKLHSIQLEFDKYTPGNIYEWPSDDVWDLDCWTICKSTSSSKNVSNTLKYGNTLQVSGSDTLLLKIKNINSEPTNTCDIKINKNNPNNIITLLNTDEDKLYNYSTTLDSFDIEYKKCVLYDYRIEKEKEPWDSE